MCLEVFFLFLFGDGELVFYYYCVVFDELRFEVVDLFVGLYLVEFGVQVFYVFY